MKLLGYTPDIDQTTEGAIIDCTSFIPTEKGMRAAPSLVDAGQPALAAECRGAAVTIDLDDSRRTFAGTPSKLYELASGAWVDRTRSVGGDYTLGLDDRWRFAQFGNITLAAAKSETLQYSDAGLFINTPTAPKAAIVETVLKQVFLADINDAAYGGDSPNRYIFSAIGLHDNWTPSVATGCVSGILTSTAGRITGAKRLGERIAIYKERAIYIGRYVGGDTIWDIQEVEGDAGTPANDSIVNIGTEQTPMHIFMGTDDFWVFDGIRPVPIGKPVRRTVFSELERDYSYRIRARHDRANALVYFYYPKTGGVVDKCVVYNYRENRWGRDDKRIEATFAYISGGYTIDGMDALSGTIDGLPDIPFDSPFWTAGESAPAVFSTDHKIYTLEGAATSSSFTINDMGDDTNVYLLSRVKPVWLKKPSAATMTNYYKMHEGDDLSTDMTSTMYESRFDVLNSARWHRLRFDMTGDCTLSDINVFMEAEADE